MNAVMIITIIAFILTMFFIFWRPKGINEAIPSTIGAIVVMFSGSISMANLLDISSKVSGAAITIVSTLVMAIVLESFGFFYWITAVLANYSKGSGIRLFWLTNLLCFLMTVLFNNDGSILITTPILILLLKNYHLKNHQKIPYLISGALIATASSAPIGVSNIVNLIALKIIGMDLYLQTTMMLVPGILGLLFLSGMLFVVFHRDIPKKLPNLILSFDFKDKPSHPLQIERIPSEIKKQMRLMKWILLFVLFLRISLFIASYMGIPIEIVAFLGSLLLLIWRWYYLKISPKDMFKKTPWHIFGFAFTMYIIIYGLNNIGLTDLLVRYFEPMIDGSLLKASLFMGGLLTVLSNLFNNHPALMIGTLTLTNMGLDPITVKTVYLANIIGSDIGSLLLPIGTLATLIWMHILKRERVKLSWLTYFKTTIIVIPPTVIFTLIALYAWIELIFNGKAQ
ncbi:MAG TPA: arsenic transporter [Bacillales bacterium]|nr:arsenic transporter [Bacillales bacterium]